MNAAQRPWLAQYPEGMPHEIEQEWPTMLALFADALRRAPDGVAVRYFDGSITYAQLDERTDRLAAALLEHGFGPDDRLGVYVQNDPSFVEGLVAAWKAGGAAVAINPMNKARELAYLLDDSGAVALLVLDDLYAGVAREVVASGRTRVTTVVTVDPRTDQTRDDPRVLGAASGAGEHRDAGDPEGVTVLRLEDVHASPAAAPPPARPSGDDVAVLTYTSGTTGEPKGALNTHSTMAFNSQTYRDLMGLTGDDVILGIAPLFHITGLIGHVGAAMTAACPLVLAHRFEPGTVLDAMREHRPTFTIGAITALMALIAAPGATRDDWASFRFVYTGGAPVAPAAAGRFREATGLPLHNAYGLTETNSPATATPPGVPSPVDATTGALSVGVPTFNTVVRILDEDGTELPAGELGEVAISGPQIVPGYWGRPEASAASLPGGELRTGDVGFLDEGGWLYLVDRKKDMINASGYKVWPREVEDVLYEHPAVREAAVVGVPDEYRGETVKAVVSLREGESATPEEIVAWAKERLAAYKYPRIVELIGDVPKTPTGKILRRNLREHSE